MAVRKIIPLDDRQRWTFRQADDPDFEWMEVWHMPTNVHLDLLHHGIILDPCRAKQENDCQWVGEKAWVYKGVFPSPDIPSDAKAFIAFDGLDTYATVVLNGTQILKTKDMFIPERVDITQNLLSDDENVLEITFDSAYLTGKKIVEQYPNHHWGCWNGDPSRLAVRKAQYHYGWDWGPTLLTCGPWRPISLEIYSSRISDLYFTTDISKSLKSAIIVAKADIEGEGEEVRFQISLCGKVVGTETVKIDRDRGFATATFSNQSPKLWYPHTYGSQPLYELSATLLQSQVPLDTASKRLGLRRVEVIQRRLEDAPGTTFLFEINNIPLFCGGSNWIPGDSFTPFISPKKYRDWVKMAVDSNQVMLRAWGGGIFEEKAFYEACDEMGVLVWQDFLFACGNYPTHQEFMELVEREAKENVKLLRHHPCIVLYAGNNEDYQYQESANLDYDPKDHNPANWLKSTFPARYIYEKILVDVTKELVPGTYYHFGSPYGGRATTDPHVGDIHQWNVWHGTQERYQNFDKLAGRFVTEFGMEAFPNIMTIDSYLTEGHLDIERYPQSSTVDFHNKAAGQERRLALYLAENIPFTMEPFEQYIYCTQLLQSECLTSAYKFLKRQWQGPGAEYCSGALVWQLNDCWAGTSWSIVDHYQRPKLGYFAIKRELQPITIGLKRTVHTVPADKYTRAYKKTIHKIEMWACNLSLQSHEVSVRIQTNNVMTRAQTSLDGLGSKVTLLPNRSTEMVEFEVPLSGKYAGKTIEAADGRVVRDEDEQQQQTVVAAYLLNGDGEQIARAINWPEPLKYVHFPKPGHVELKLIRNKGNLRGDNGPFPATALETPPEATAVQVSSDVPVKGLVLETVDPRHQDHEVRFLDNGIDLVPGESVSIGVRGLKCGEEGRLKVRYLGL